ncbi:hypothetical protein IHE45_20G006500 [Dioscorea alata]|uniref:Uncharacterized protein n=1 Tax=Dioscorea alata TaxID=55571 RepID=A0ACB7TRY1_DIOAL|nr:hypothetical protein IHE45_20G006500 [Dioscorea alata]
MKLLEIWKAYAVTGFVIGFEVSDNLVVECWVTSLFFSQLCGEINDWCLDKWVMSLELRWGGIDKTEFGVSRL